MSAETVFQVGDTVRVLPNQGEPERGLHSNTHVTVEHADETHVRVSGSAYEWFARRFELVTPYVTPAPLDPSKVRPGDTVTVDVLAVDYLTSEFSVRAKVTGNLGGAWWVGPVEVARNGTWLDSVTLTDHQPAPEPEPEWKRGTVALVRFPGGEDDRPNLPASYAEIDGPGHGEWRALNGDCADYASDVEVVRPLVVIDPAEVDVDALAAAIRKAEETGGPFTATTKRLAYAVLAELGIEVSR